MAGNISARYYEVTSNYYFKNICSPRSLEIVFVDGLHTYDQALYDIENSLINIKNGGVVILHDCNPPHKNAAMPAKSHKQAAMQKLPGWTNEWCGDVWKAICHLRSFRNDLNIFVLDCDYGIGIITKGVSENNLFLKNL